MEQPGSYARAARNEELRCPICNPSKSDIEELEAEMNTEYENALARLDEELHPVNYALYVYLHDVISGAIELEAQLEGLRATRTHLQKDVKELQAQLADAKKLELAYIHDLSVKEHKAEELEAKLAKACDKVLIANDAAQAANTLRLKAEAQLDRVCLWKRQKLGTDWDEYDSWGTSCGEDYAIEEEWDDKVPNFCNNCGGKAKAAIKGEE